MTVKALHCIRMCLTMQVVRQVKHCGCGSCFSMKEWVRLVRPMHNRDITTYSLLDFLKAGSPFFQVGLNLEEFIMEVNISSLMPFCVKEFTDCILGNVSKLWHTCLIFTGWHWRKGITLITHNYPESLTFSHSNDWFSWVGFYGISTIVGYLMPNPLYR